MATIKEYEKIEDSLLYEGYEVHWRLIQVLIDTRIKEVLVLIECAYKNKEKGYYTTDFEPMWCLSDEHRKQLYEDFVNVVEGDSTLFDEIMTVRNFVPKK